MRILVAPDKLKGALSAQDAAAAIARGFSLAFGAQAQIVRLPLADGGEGTLDAFVSAGARRVSAVVRGPLGDPVEAAFGMLGDLAVIEMASASGLGLVPAGRRDPMRATTFGTGELIRHALDNGAQRVIIGLGGSATNDGGAGALVALGARLLDADGLEVAPEPANFTRLRRLDLGGLDARVRSTRFDAACDVSNPLLGRSGASAVFGPQKGAGEPEVAALELALRRLADLSAHELGADLREVPGTGAAGGLGFGLLAFLGARLRSGFQIVAEVMKFEEQLADSSLCATAEGAIDGQTLHGKVVAGVASVARARHVPVVAFGGSVDAIAERALWEEGVICVPLADRPLTPAESLAQAAPLLERAAARFGRALNLSLKRRP